jgi:hypothetical protein
MVDPISAGTMAAISMGTTVAGGVVSGIGNIFQGNANAASYNYKAGVALANSTINKQNAVWATEAGGIAATESGLKSGEVIAQTKVGQSGSNLDVNTGTNAAVRDTQQAAAQTDQEIIRWDAAKKAYGYETKAAMDEAEASMDTAAASNSKTSGILGAIGSFINAGSSVASKWSQGNTIGIGTSSGPIGMFTNGGNDGLAPSWTG